MTDQFEPAYRMLVVACKSDKRWFDLDSVRTPFSRSTLDSEGFSRNSEKMDHRVAEGMRSESLRTNTMTHAGAPPLDYWLIDTRAGVERVLKSMLPERVCKICGEPSRRITAEQNQSSEREALAAHLIAQREAKGLTRKQIAAHFPSATGGLTGCVTNWESNFNVPTAEQWSVLKELLDLSDDFDAVISGERAWTESTVDYEHISDHTSGLTQNANGETYHRLPATKSRIPPTEFSDCNHNDWRAGVVLDPFDLTTKEPDVGARYIIGDVFDTLATLEPNSVDLVFSSPPFLALRSYLPADHPDKAKEIGSEATPADFLDTLLDVVEACDRVLAPHGSLVFELGDTFAGSGGAGGDYNEGGLRDGQPGFTGSAAMARTITHAKDCALEGDDARGPEWGARRGTECNCGALVRAGNAAHWREKQRHKSEWPDPKSLSGIPTLFAWSLAYGRNLLRPERETPRWRIRNIIVWARPNPPVGALGDKFRPATSYLTVACKSDKRWFDLDAVRNVNNPDRMHELGALNEKSKASPGAHLTSANGTGEQNPAGAPPLDYWEIPTQPFSGAHYATFPTALVVKPVKAMCPAKVCRVCGEPSRRIVGDAEYPRTDTDRVPARLAMNDGDRVAEGVNQHTQSNGANTSVTRVAPTLGWTDCGHNDYRNGMLLDPFAGSGTSLSVATGHGRDAIGIDIDERNAELALERVGPLFLTVENLSAPFTFPKVEDVETGGRV